MPPPPRLENPPSPPSVWPARLVTIRNESLKLIALPVVVTLLGVVATYLLAGPQEVVGDQAVEQSKQVADLHSDSVRVVSERDAESSSSLVAFDEDVPASTASAIVQNRYGGDLHGGRVVEQASESGGSAAQKHVRFSLVGLHNAPVKVDDIRLRITRVASPPAGSLVDVETPPSSSGMADVENLTFDLSGPHAAGDLVEPRNEDGELFFDTKQIILEKDEPLGISVFVKAMECDCDFVLEADFMDDTSQTIKSDTGPWNLVTTAKAYRRSYTGVSGKTQVKECTWPQCP